MPRAALLFITAISLFACSASNDGGNGTDCLKNDDCESKYCSSNKCRPKPAYGGTGSAGSAGSGSGGSAGAGGS